MLTAIDLEPFFNDLAEKTWTVLPVKSDRCLELLKCARWRDQRGDFRTAHISQDEAGPAAQPTIRNDRTCWLDPARMTLENTEEATLNDLQNLTQKLKNELRLPLQEFECHYAIYEPGHFYRRHTDTTQRNNRRVISFVLYLNEDWLESDGGHLLAYQAGKELFSVSPQSGQLVLFKSDIEHEVVATRRTRYSLTGWMRR